MNLTEKEISVSFEPWWMVTPAEMLSGKLEDRELTPEALSKASGIPFCILRDFLEGILPDLTPEQYFQIETALKLPVNYFARLNDLNTGQTNKVNPQLRDLNKKD